MNFLIYLAAGAVVGLVASRIMADKFMAGVADRNHSRHCRCVPGRVLHQPSFGYRDDE